MTITLKTKERPVLFSAPMVLAILSGAKTKTRRVCKPAQFYSLTSVVEVPDPMERGQVYNGSHFGDEEGDVQFASPYGGPGELLWVREAFRLVKTLPGGAPGDDVPPSKVLDSTRRFEADGTVSYPDARMRVFGKLRPGIHMPRWASRITLEVTGVHIERLQDISEEDARAEGITKPFGSQFWHADPRGSSLPGETPIWAFRNLWESINGEGSWEANPWVWVIEFKRLEKTA